MKDIILDTLIDSAKILPFLFITFLLMEYLEHKMSNKSKKIIKKSGKFGPFFGGILGAFPQCGFSVSATNLYATRIITMGTLIAVYLSTSDEMLPILISEKVDILLIIKIIALKVVIGMIFGFIIDLIMRKRKDTDYEIKDFCKDEHCHCEHGILKSTIKHTLSIILFIAIISFILNVSFEYFGEDMISKLFMKNSILSPFIASLVGLIPNCGASVVLTELYLKESITLSSAIAGLLTGAGVAIPVLFKTNKNIKENIFIVLSIYFIGSLIGVILSLFGV